MNTPAINPALLQGIVYKKGDQVNLLVATSGGLFHGENKLPDNAVFVGPQPATTRGPTTNPTRDTYRIYDVYPVSAGASITTEAEKYCYKVALQLPAQVWQVPIEVQTIDTICHNNLAATKAGKPSGDWYKVKTAVYLIRPLRVLTTDPSGSVQDLPLNTKLEITGGPKSRTNRVIAEGSKFKGDDLYYTCYLTAASTATNSTQ